MKLHFSDGTISSNFMGMAPLFQSYKSDGAHRSQYLSALWNTAGSGIGGGLLQDFEIKCMAENALAREYKAAANSPCTDDPFLREPKLENLHFLCAAPPSSCQTLLEYDHQRVLTKNRPFLEQLIQRTSWDPDSLRAFRMLLILLLQLKQSEDVVPLEEEEKETLELTLRKYQLAAVPSAARIYPTQDGAFYLRDGHIYKAVFPDGKQARHTAVSRKEAVIQDFAPYGEVQRIELTAGGQLTESSAGAVYQTWAGCGRPPLRMTTCCGDVYMLLCRDGRILSNVDESVYRGWKNAVWVGAGLNSVSAICGEERRLFASMPIKSLTGVREAATYCDGMDTHYGAILQDGSLRVDEWAVIGPVDAAAICSMGVVYACGREIRLCRFCPTCSFADLFPEQLGALCISDEDVLALCVDDCTMLQPPGLRLIWLTETGVFQKWLDV